MSRSRCCWTPWAPTAPRSIADYAASEANLSGAWADRMFAMIDAMGVPRTPNSTRSSPERPAAAIAEALAWVDREHGDSAAYLRSGGLTEAELAACAGG